MGVMRLKPGTSVASRGGMGVTANVEAAPRPMQLTATTL
jgi:hypothetical protein